MLIDIHCHLEDKEFHDLAEVVSRAKEAGLSVIINNGIDQDSNRKTLDLSKLFDIVKPALGLFPIDALKLSDNEIEEEIDWISKQKFIAIGEVGLDYHWDTLKHEKQQWIFRKLVDLASDIDKPLIIHSRKAEQDCFEILIEKKVKKAVWHCFNGDMRLADEILKRGWYFSIPASILYSRQFQQIAEQIPLSHILTETDSPYLSPFRGKRNEPAFVKEAVRKIAEIKDLNEEEVVKQIFMNYQRVFL